MRYCLILWTLDVHLCSRSPQGERGLKWGVCVNGLPVAGSLPAGGRGLKFGQVGTVVGAALSLPAGGVD